MSLNVVSFVKRSFGALGSVGTAVQNTAEALASTAENYALEAKVDSKIQKEVLGRTYANRRNNALGEALSEAKETWMSFDQDIRDSVLESSKEDFDTKSFMKFLEE